MLVPEIVGAFLTIILRLAPCVPTPISFAIGGIMLFSYYSIRSLTMTYGFHQDFVVNEKEEA